MELSILQHNKDNNPRTVSIGEVADLIREGRWPSGWTITPERSVSGKWQT